MDHSNQLQLMEQRIEKFNQFVMSQDVNKIPIGLFNGKMGLCIYFYHQARISGDKRYDKFAEKLLNSIYGQLHNGLPINLENGLIGICKGILFLIENGFIQGNPDYILKDLEDEIFSKLYFKHLIKGTDHVIEEAKIAIHSALYFCKRLTNSKLSKIEKTLYEQIIIRTINHIENIVISNKMTEPYLFSRFDYFPILYLELINNVYELGFYNYKIKKVCDEWNELILSAFPLLKSHRLLLASMLEKVNRYYNSTNWEEHIYLLQHGININNIIDIDFRNKNLYIFNGLSGFSYFLKEKNVLTDSFKKYICKKIACSELWIDFDKSNEIEKLSYIGLVNGLAGVIDTYLEIDNKLKK